MGVEGSDGESRLQMQLEDGSDRCRSFRRNIGVGVRVLSSVCRYVSILLIRHTDLKRPGGTDGDDVKRIGRDGPSAWGANCDTECYTTPVVVVIPSSHLF